MTDMKRWRGLKDLVRDAVEQGASAVERVHLETARRPFDVLKRIPPLAEVVSEVHQVHDAVVTTTYGSVRAVTRAVDMALEVAIDVLDSEH